MARLITQTKPRNTDPLVYLPIPIWLAYLYLSKRDLPDPLSHSPAVKREVNLILTEILTGK